MLTNIQKLKAYARCVLNPIYCIENYLDINSPTQGNIQFKLLPRQKDIINQYEANRFNLVVKPRQAGVSILTAAYIAFKLAFSLNTETIVIITHNLETSAKFLDDVRFFLKRLPKWVWGEEYIGDENKRIFTTDNKREIKLVNGNYIKAVAASKDALRGFGISHLVIDEAAYITFGAEIFSIMITTLSTRGHCTIISTPNGEDKLFYRLYSDSKMGLNSFNIIEARWYEDSRFNHGLHWTKGEELKPEIEFTFESYTRWVDDGWKPISPWYEDMCRGLNYNPNQIAQELDALFINRHGGILA